MYVVLIVCIILYIIDAYLLHRYKYVVSKVTKHFEESFERKILEYLFYIISFGSLSIREAINMLVSLSNNSPTARRILDKIYENLFLGSSLEYHTKQRDSLPYLIHNILFSIADPIKPSFVADTISNSLLNSLSIAQNIASRIDDTMSIVLFVSFFVPTIIVQIIFLLGYINLVILVPTINAALTLGLLKYTGSIQEKVYQQLVS